MKNRKPTYEQQKREADLLLIQEGKIQKILLENAKQKLGELMDKMKSLGEKVPKRVINKLSREIDEQRETVDRHDTWLKEHGLKA